MKRSKPQTQGSKHPKYGSQRKQFRENRKKIQIQGQGELHEHLKGDIEDIDDFSSESEPEVEHVRCGNASIADLDKFSQISYAELDDVDESEQIAWSDSSNSSNKMSDESVDEFNDFDFKTNLKLKGNETINNYNSDEDDSSHIQAKCPMVCSAARLSEGTIEELSPSPVVEKISNVINEECKSEKCIVDVLADPGSEDEDELINNDGQVKGKKRVVKGGLVEQLKKVIAREAADYSFWHHDAKNSQNMDTLLTMTVESVDTCFSITTLICGTRTMKVCVMLPEGKVKSLELHEGSVLRIHPPWKKMFCKDINSVILLCTYHLEVLSSLPTVNTMTTSEKELCLFHKQNIQAGGEFSCNKDDEKSDDSMGALVTTSFATEVTSQLVGGNVLSALERSRKNVSFCARVQRVFFRMSAIPNGNFKQQLTSSQDLRQSLRYVLLVQDNENVLSEIIIPEQMAANNSEWGHAVSRNEGNLCHFRNLLFNKRKSFNRNPVLLSITERFFPRDNLEKVQNETSDSIEDSTSQNAKLCSSLYLYSFELNAGLSSVECQVAENDFDICYTPPVDVTDSFKDFQSVDTRISCDVQLLTITSSNSNDLSNGFQASCNLHCFLLSNNQNEMVTVLVLPSFYIPSILKRHIHMYDSDNEQLLLHLKDLRCHNGKLFLDLYSRIFVIKEATASSGYKDDETRSADFFLKRQKCRTIPPCIPFLCESADEGDIVAVEGLICGVEEESAMFWNACGKCSNDDVESMSNGNVWCSSCECETSPTFRMQLAIFLHISSLGSMCILCNLLEETVSNLLPKPSDSNFEGYDIKSILNKTFGPKLCQVVDVHRNKRKILLKEARTYGPYVTVSKRKR